MALSTRHIEVLLPLAAPIDVPLATSPAQSAATLALSAPTQVPLATAAAQSDATLAFEAFADAFSTVVLGDSPTGYWRLGEPSGTTAVDSAAAYDGTYLNTPTLAQTGAVATSSDTAVSFASASSESVELPNTIDLRILTANFSLEFWIKRNGNPSAQEWIYSPRTDAVCYLHTTGVLRTEATSPSLDSTVSVCDNAWHHVVLSATRSGTVQWIIDGVQRGSGTGQAWNYNATGVHYIARRVGGSYFNGSLDEVAFYNGTVLTLAQALEHYETAQGAGAAEVPLDPAAAQSAATVALKAATQVPLGSSPAQSAATLALSAITQVPLGSAPAQSAATLALKATTAVPLATAAAQSAATITLTATTAVPLATAASQSAATLTVVSTPAIPLATSAAQSAATLALTAQTQVVLATAAAQSAATLALVTPTQVPLATAAAQSAATAVVVVPVELPLGTSAAQSSATAAVGYPGAYIPFDTAAAQSGAGWFHLDAYGPYADATKTNSATYYWRFEDTDVARDHGALGDAGIRAGDGTYVNAPSLVAGALAQAATETGVQFVSASSQRVTATADGLGSNLDESTIEFFVKTTTSARQFILGASNSGVGSSNVTGLAIRTNTDSADAALAGATRFLLTDNSGTNMRCHITTNIYDGNWHHVVAVVGASGWEIYVDGTGVTEVSPSGTPGTYNNFNVALDLGAINFQGVHTGYFDGALDEVAIYPTRFTAFGVAVHYVLSKLYVELQASAAQSAATLALAGPVTVALGTAAAQSSASLAAKAATDVPLGAAVAQSSATLSLGVEVNAVELELAALYPDPELYPDEDLYPYIGARAQSAATLDLSVSGQLSLSTASAQSAASLAIKAPAQVVLGSAAALSLATLTVSYPVTQPLDPSAAQSAATLVLGIYVPPVDTFPDLGARDFEVTTGGVFDQTVTGGVVAGAIRSGAPVAITGGVFSEATRSGVIEITLGGTFAEGERSAAVDETVTGGYYDEGETSASEDRITGARPDEGQTGADEDYWTGGDPDEDERSGDLDEVLTGGEVY